MSVTKNELIEELTDLGVEPGMLPDTVCGDDTIKSLRALGTKKQSLKSKGM